MKLSEVSQTSPQDANCCLKRAVGEKRFIIYRKITNLAVLFGKIEFKFTEKVTPPLVGKPTKLDKHWNLIWLPLETSSRNIGRPTDHSKVYYLSQNVPEQLIDTNILEATHKLKENLVEIWWIQAQNRKVAKNRKSKKRQIVKLASQKGTSTGLIVLSLTKHSSNLKKSEF